MMRITPKKIKAAFGFKKLPFAKESLSVFKYSRFTNALDSLIYLVERSGIGTLIAPPGSGKSVLLGTLFDSLSDTAYCTVYVAHTTCSISDLYRQILVGFGVEPTLRKADMFRSLQERLSYLATHKKIRPVLAIDEAHRLPTSFLEEIRLFTNFDCDRRDEIALILAGQPQLAAHLRFAVNEPLSQRVIVRTTLTSFSAIQTNDYVSHRLKSVGRSATLFTDCGFEALHKASRGIPRLIDQIAERSIVQALRDDKNTIDAQIVSKIAVNSHF